MRLKEYIKDDVQRISTEYKVMKPYDFGEYLPKVKKGEIIWEWTWKNTNKFSWGIGNSLISHSPIPDKENLVKKGILKELRTVNETGFWDRFAEYIIRQIGKDTYEVSVWKRGDTPSQIYKCVSRGGKIQCSCPARGPCKHIKMVADWINKGKPEHPFFKNVKKTVLQGIKKL